MTHTPLHLVPGVLGTGRGAGIRKLVVEDLTRREVVSLDPTAAYTDLFPSCVIPLNGPHRLITGYPGTHATRSNP